MGVVDVALGVVTCVGCMHYFRVSLVPWRRARSPRWRDGERAGAQAVPGRQAGRMHAAGVSGGEAGHHTADVPWPVVCAVLNRPTSRPRRVYASPPNSIFHDTLPPDHGTFGKLLTRAETSYLPVTHLREKGDGKGVTMYYASGCSDLFARIDRNTTVAGLNRVDVAIRLTAIELQSEAARAHEGLRERPVQRLESETRALAAERVALWLNRAAVRRNEVRRMLPNSSSASLTSPCQSTTRGTTPR